MASHGKVLDLFDDRYLRLQDVVGNVEPLPMIIPYERYTQNPVVYSMDTNHAIFLALLQDFTERKARETGKELWTWYVQWNVNQTAARQLSVNPHSRKKPRFDQEQPNLPTAQRSRHSAPPITVRPRILDPELMHEEDMLRILVDIIQVNSAVVPNFIEFLYRWIDYYEGDGRALKAALHGEIPSLWDFEHHPLMVPEDIKKKMKQANEESKDGENKAGGKTPTHNNTEELTQNSPTKKMRNKPDLATLERRAEESERLQYREVHFGIQPPKLDEPLPPLINIPQDSQKRTKYYAACFKSRQRAFYMLMEAGVTPQQIRDYNRCQKENVKDTPSTGGEGLRNYERDAQMAQKVFEEKEQYAKKQREIAISDRLAVEARVAANNATSEEASGVPLIPATPSYPPRQDMAAQMLRKIQQATDKTDQKINIVPEPLVGMMKSELFERAKDRETVARYLEDVLSGPAQRRTIVGEEGGSQTSASEDENIHPDFPHLMSMPHTTPTPYHADSMTLPTANFIPYIGVPPSQAYNARPQHQLSGGFAEYDPFITQSSGEGTYRHAFSSSIFDETIQPDGFNGSNALNSNLPYLPTYEPRLPAPHQPQRLSLPYQPHDQQSYVPAQYHAPSYSVDPALPFPVPPPTFAQQYHDTYAPDRGQSNGSFTLPNQPVFNGSNNGFMTTGQQLPANVHPYPPPTFLQPLQPSIHRTAPTPLSFIPPPSPMSTLAPSLLVTSPFATSHSDLPIQIYFQKIVFPANTLGPGGAKLGDGDVPETDAFLLGHVHPGSGEIVLSKAIFLPVGVWKNATARVRNGKCKVLESYPMPGGDVGSYPTGVAHRAAYEKVKEAFGFMIAAPAELRERGVTKRWRVSRGPMTASERGAVWEGWGVEVGRQVKMGREERVGAVVLDSRIDGAKTRDWEEERRQREMKEWFVERDDEDDEEEVEEDVRMEDFVTFGDEE
ncbi:hypothetical protein COCCADRAFT_35917 [Bipolaris zeicola 26-R-13]|uniref:Uncharacterized protein n=1 Tax=Cochliobolus carbonum (strain 26-R-13) TaxID=930089 RepID=W6YA90_COCC2|nr:uncharacterized protein COCCADRAFT_35917 [Bipolaris zeicola 26-R-13]EUC34465.1 hypothetical protein COCCADRAFT_35917 [Bipolaris zeicola 26-R-13]